MKMRRSNEDAKTRELQGIGDMDLAVVDAGFQLSVWNGVDRHALEEVEWEREDCGGDAGGY